MNKPSCTHCGRSDRTLEMMNTVHGPKPFCQVECLYCCGTLCVHHGALVERLREELGHAYDNLTATQETSNRLLDEARAARAALANAKAEHDVALRVASAARRASEAGFCGEALYELTRALEDFEAGGERARRPSDSSALAARLEKGFAESDTEDC